MVEKPKDDGVLRVSTLATARPTAFDLRPDAPEMRALAEELGLSGLRKLRFHGEVAPEGRRGWHLAGTIGATVVQPCVVTLAPVTTRVDAPVERRFLPDEMIFPPEMPDEAEMPEDDSLEPLGDEIDLRAIMAESLALALPLYPRAEGAELGEARFAEDGTEPLSDEDVKPFAGLKALRDKLDGDS